MSDGIRLLDRIDVGRSMCCVFGPPDSGKSNLAKYIFSRKDFRSHLVYDPLYGWDEEEYNLVRPPESAPEYRRYEESGNDHLNAAAERFILDHPEEDRPNYLVVDEAGRLLPNQKNPGSAMSDLIHFNAHYNVGVFYIAQRPSELNTDAESKSLYTFVMGYRGRSDRRTLKEIHSELPAVLEKAKDELGPYAGAVVGPNRRIAPFEPAPNLSREPKRI